MVVPKDSLEPLASWHGKGRNVTGEEKAITCLFCTASSTCGILTQSQSTQCLKPHFNGYKPFLIVASLVGRDFSLSAGVCSFCSWFNCALLAAVLGFGCHQKRFFSFRSSKPNTKFSPLSSLPFLYNRNTCNS